MAFRQILIYWMCFWLENPRCVQTPFKSCFCNISGTNEDISTISSIQTEFEVLEIPVTLKMTFCEVKDGLSRSFSYLHQIWYVDRYWEYLGQTS